ncbi:hypothetical protein FY034_17475 (plasmid) [Trichlorobacter lovleyi]|uniref:hypothetical protein n=1 Tax=Trichlorobacter lovleyi TaxID=313985 RepID=UPI00223EB9E8|nr:hypothetical protein [Trichlorobacter lovleyi]QOX80814.1 hypothetical protein FY034_17475 [Trichlorobacter lovleyi]
MKKKALQAHRKIAAICFLAITVTSGCASFTAENIGRGMQHGSIGGGIFAAPIFVVGLATEKIGGEVKRSNSDNTEDAQKPGRPAQIGEYSPRVHDLIQRTPTPSKNPQSGIVTWDPRLYMDGTSEVTADLDNTPPDKMALRAFIFDCENRFKNGQFGDDANQHFKNLVSWRRCKKIHAEYKSPYGKKVIIVSDNCRPATLMLEEDFQNKVF